MNGHIPWRKVDIWIQGYRSIWLSTARPDGRPHCVPVWFWWQADKPIMYIVTHYTSQKAKNLATQPYVVLNAGNADDTIILEGTAHPISEVDERQLVNSYWMEKYVDPYSGTKATVGGDEDRMYRVEIEHVMVWEYGAMSTRTDWYFTHI